MLKPDVIQYLEKSGRDYHPLDEIFERGLDKIYQIT